MNNMDNHARFGGLTLQEVQQSRSQHGANVLTQKKQKTIISTLLANFSDPMIRILLLALAINALFLITHPNWLETAGIATAIILAVVVSTLAEIGSESAFKRLRQSIQNISVKVRRSGKTQTIPVDQIVVGDIILLEPGDKIIADGIIVSGQIEVDQSSLNGEAKEATKKAVDQDYDPAKWNLLDQQLLFNGTIVSSGQAVMRVVHIGDKTVYGLLASQLQEASPSSPLKEKLEKLAHKISRFGYIGAVLVFCSYLFNAIVMANDYDLAAIGAQVSNFHVIFPLFINAVTLAVSLIVMSVPEGLPMMITVVLSVNMRRMMKDKVLIRKLNSIDTAGCLNILFTDKTGTLTSGHLKVTHFISPDATLHPLEEIPTLGSQIRLLQLNLLYNNGSLSSDEGPVGGNSTDRALLAFATSLPPHQFSLNKGTIVPFSSERKLMITEVLGEYNLSLVKGAPERILSRCRYYQAIDGSRHEITSLAALEARIDALGGQSYRIVALATGPLGIDANKLEGMTLIGLLALRDQIRPETYEAVKLVSGAGVQTVMVTGDSKKTAMAIGRECGLLSDGLVLTSDELARLDDDQVSTILPSLQVLARAQPSDKTRLVRIAQDQGLVVGMTGDGVNDAPALKRADVGFAMGSGTEITKEAADIIITDDNFLSIAKAIGYGRTIFKSIRKFVIFQLTINFCAVLISIIAPLLNVKTPISVVQMLWINLVIDTLAGLAFGGELPRIKYMKEKPKKRNEMIINRYMWEQIIVGTLFMTLISVFFLKNTGVFSRQGEAYLMTGYFALFMFTAIFNSFNARTHEVNLFDYLVLNKGFVYIMWAITLIQLLLIYCGGQFFNTVPLSFPHLILIVFLSFAIIPLDLLRKAITRKFNLSAGT